MPTDTNARLKRRVRKSEHDGEMWAHVEPEPARRLLLSALEVFAARGFHAATTRAIGERAGMSSTAVYVHYKAKHDLLFEISRIGHQANLDDTKGALEQASNDPVERVETFVSTFARWHADNHVLARVVQYEFKNLPRHQFRQIAAIRNEHQLLMREELKAGITAKVFDVTDLDGTVLAVLSLCIDLARWYRPSPDHRPAAVGELYGQLVRKMIEAR